MHDSSNNMATTGVLYSQMFKVLVIYFLCCLVSCDDGTPYTLEPVELPTDGDFKTFTHQEIKKYDGSDPDLPIYMGIKGVVFDVSTGKEFYGKGSSYNSLVGMDCSKAIAKMSLESADMTHDISDLTPSLLKSLDDTFKGTYVKKYPIVGYMEYLVTGIKPGCIGEFEDLTKEFLQAEDGEARLAVIAKATTAAEKITDESEKLSAKMYLITMNKFVEKGSEFIDAEIIRVKNIRDGKLSDKKKQQFRDRLNILNSFRIPVKDEL